MSNHQLKFNFNGVLDEPFTYTAHRNFNLQPFNGEAGTGTTVMRDIKHFEGISFTGSDKIRGHADVATIMAALESKSVEHSFAVHVNKDRVPLIQLLGIGTRGAVLFDTPNMVAAAKLHDTEKMYLVHNHPSGNLLPSSADLKMTERIATAFKNLDIDIGHIIMNTYKKQYTYLEDGIHQEYFREDPGRTKASYKALTFSDMNILRSPLSSPITTSEDVVKILQRERFSAFPKFGVLVLDTGHHVLGNFLLDRLNLQTVTDIAPAIPNATSVIGYGNFKHDKIQELKDKLELFDIRFLDYIQYNSNGVGVKDAYMSYATESLLNETHRNYGTNSLKGKNLPWEQDLFQDRSTSFKRGR